MRRFLTVLFFGLSLSLNLFAQANASTYEYMNMGWWEHYQDKNLLDFAPNCL